VPFLYWRYLLSHFSIISSYSYVRSTYVKKTAVICFSHSDPTARTSHIKIPDVRPQHDSSRLSSVLPQVRFFFPPFGEIFYKSTRSFLTQPRLQGPCSFLSKEPLALTTESLVSCVVTFLDWVFSYCRTPFRFRFHVPQNTSLQPVSWCSRRRETVVRDSLLYAIPLFH